MNNLTHSSNSSVASTKLVLPTVANTESSVLKELLGDVQCRILQASQIIGYTDENLSEKDLSEILGKVKDLHETQVILIKELSKRNML